MNNYRKHLFICTNKRQNGDQSCQDHHANELYQYAKVKYKSLRLKEQGIRISSAGCLGNCKQGPVLVVYPAGEWYTYRNKEDIDRILSIVALHSH